MDSNELTLMVLEENSLRNSKLVLLTYVSVNQPHILTFCRFAVPATWFIMKPVRNGPALSRSPRRQARHSYYLLLIILRHTHNEFYLPLTLSSINNFYMPLPLAPFVMGYSVNCSVCVPQTSILESNFKLALALMRRAPVESFDD